MTFSKGLAEKSLRHATSEGRLVATTDRSIQFDTRANMIISLRIMEINRCEQSGLFLEFGFDNVY